MNTPVSYAFHADLGGRLGFGPVQPEADEPPFHAPWEARALALTLAMGATGAWNLDMSRSAREQLPAYLQLSYYAIWISALEALLLAKGLLTEDEQRAGRALQAPVPLPRVLRAEAVETVLARGSPTERAAPHAARFEVGQSVRTRAHAAPHHTRLPGYARGRVGRIERVHGCHVFPDAHAQGLGEQAQWLYTVVFEGRALWGEESPGGLSVSIDAWESYLEAAA